MCKMRETTFLVDPLSILYTGEVSFQGAGIVELINRFISPVENPVSDSAVLMSERKEEFGYWGDDMEGESLLSSCRYVLWVLPAGVRRLP